MLTCPASTAFLDNQKAGQQEVLTSNWLTASEAETLSSLSGLPPAAWETPE